MTKGDGELGPLEKDKRFRIVEMLLVVCSIMFGFTQTTPLLYAIVSLLFYFVFTMNGFNKLTVFVLALGASITFSFAVYEIFSSTVKNEFSSVVFFLMAVSLFLSLNHPSLNKSWISNIRNCLP